MSDHRHLPPGIAEHDEEAQRGLPERLPDDEQLIWQGSPDWKSMAVQVFHVRKVALYLVAMMLARGFAVGAEAGIVSGVVAAIWLVPLFAVAIAGLMILAYMSARDTLYTITSKRLVMRIGIALTITYNIPLKKIHSAGMAKRQGDVGDIALTLASGNKIAFINLWPHVRPWRLSNPEPMLRCVPNAELAAQKLSSAWAAANRQAAIPSHGEKPNFSQTLVTS